MRQDPAMLLTRDNSRLVGDIIVGTTEGVRWSIEVRAMGFTGFFIVKVGSRTKTCLSMTAAQRERDVLVEMFAPRIPA